VVRRGVLVERLPAGDRLAEQGEQQEAEEEDRKAVLVQAALHRCISPTARYRTSAAVMKTV
jgi:hypothetical protein